jgi:hypothetical protein
MYAVVFECKEARVGIGRRPIVTAAGTKARLLVEPEGWVPATSGEFSGSFAGAKRFRSEADANDYASELDDLILYLDGEVIPGTHTLTTDAVCALQDQANEIREFTDEQKENGDE